MTEPKTPVAEMVPLSPAPPPTPTQQHPPALASSSPVAGATGAPAHNISLPAADSEDTRSVAGSEKSASSRSGIPKFGGSRLPTKTSTAHQSPSDATGMASAHGASNSSLASASGISRISRPCAGHSKAAVPKTETASKSKMSSSYDYVRRASDDLNRYKLSDLIEMDEFEEDFFGNRLHNFSSTLPKTLKTFNSSFDNAYNTYKNCRSPFENRTCFIRDLFEDIDFFGNPIVTYPPRRPSSRKDYSPVFFKDDPFKDYASSNSSYNSYSKPPKGYSRERSSSRERSRERSPSLRRTSLGSTGTGSSMDALWDLHPRRLSEAGLSRYSDNSTVLTEDTNSFIIGQRVFVGGTKPGQIAYIGETQFAPGEWAGIVLDQPIGKNDGSVGGIRYFQCEAKRGVFSRLTRLTRYPLGPDAAAGGDAYCASPSPTNGMRKTQISPTTSTRSGLSISNTSLASANVDFKIGDRVIIKSGQGSKVGTLRYMGFTAFANGEWCGVELDEPRGKNDGSVAGERYFDCRPSYGLFAPVSKVSRSPSNRKPSNCVVHSSSMRRSNSKESLLSMNSSMTSTTPAARRVRLGVTSLTPKKSQPAKVTPSPMPSRTALQDVLKEKQQHIEQLLKERDLERAEITKAASLADEAEQKYVSIQKEFENYRHDCDRKFKEYISKLTQLENETRELLGQLDEERTKNEDWQFKFEEAAIIKSDAESTNEEHVAKIAELELVLSQLRAEKEADSGKISHLTEANNMLKEYSEAIKVELEHAIEKRTSLESEETKSIELVQTLQSQVEEANAILKQHQEVSNKQLDDFNKQLSRLNSEHEVETFKQNQEIEKLRAKYTNDMNAKNDELKLLTLNLEEGKTLLENTQKEHEKYKYEVGLMEQSTKKELDKLKMEISAKILELENQHEANKTQHEDFKKLEEALAMTQKALESQIRETENVNMEEEKSMMEVGKLRTLLDESNNTITKLKEELELKVDAAKKELEASHAKQNEMNQQMAALKNDLSLKLEEFTELQSKHQHTEEELAKSYQKLEKEKTELKNIQDQLNIELQHLEEAKTKDSQLELQLGDSQRSVTQLEEKLAEVVVTKNKMEAEIQQLLGASGEESSKLEILNKELRDKQAELESTRTQYEGKIKELEHCLQEVKINFANAEEKTKIEIESFQKTNVSLLQSIEELNAASGHSEQALNKILADVKNELKTTKQDVVEKESALEKLKQDMTNQIQAKNQVETNLENVTKQSHELQAKLDEAIRDAATLKDDVQRGHEQLQLVNKAMQQHTAENEDLVGNIKSAFQEQISSLKTTLDEKETTVRELLANIEEIEKQNSQKDANATEKDLEIEEMLKSQLELKKHSEELRLDVENSKQQFANGQQEIVKLNEKIHDLVTKLAEKETELLEAHKSEAVILEKNNKITTLETKLNNGNKTIEAFSAQLEASKANEIKLHNDLEVKNNECQKLKEDVATKMQIGSDVNHQLSLKNAEISKLQAEYQSNLSEKMQLDVLNAELREKLGKSVDAQTQGMNEIKSLTEKFNVCLKLFQIIKVTDEHKTQLLQSKEVEEAEVLRDVVSSLQVQIVNDNKDKLQYLEQLINVNNDNMQSANSKIRHQANEIMLLQQEVLKAKLEAEKKVVKVSNETHVKINNNNSTNPNSNDYKQLLEEKLEAETQVEFMQSIIADMQKKSEEQKARIEILESGYSPAAADELQLIGLIDKKIAPRLYCDICEEFDLHDTEDCPAQADDDDIPAPSPPDAKKKEKPPPRPYCEICKVFGHDTDDCTEDETY